jgi:hypothetical protein
MGNKGMDDATIVLVIEQLIALATKTHSTKGELGQHIANAEKAIRDLEETTTGGQAEDIKEFATALKYLVLSLKEMVIRLHSQLDQFLEKAVATDAPSSTIQAASAKAKALLARN